MLVMDDLYLWFFLGRMVLLGTLFGGALGVVDGLVLYATTRVLGHPPRRGEALFRELGGVVCALTSALLASAAFWAMFRGPISPTNRSRDLVMLVFVPTIVATIAMWVAGRRVAGRYVRERL